MEKGTRLTRPLQIRDVNTYIPYIELIAPGLITIGEETLDFDELTIIGDELRLHLPQPPISNFDIYSYALVKVEDKSNIYKIYNEIISANSVFGSNIFNVGQDISVCAGFTTNVLNAKCVMLIYNNNLQIKFNDSEDILYLTPSSPDTDTVFSDFDGTLTLQTIKMAAQIPSGTANSVNIQLFITT